MKIPGLGYLNHNWVCSYIVAIGTFVAEKTHYVVLGGSISYWEVGRGN